MPLVRKIRNWKEWATLTEAVRAGAPIPIGVCDELFDKELSVYEIVDPDDYSKLAAALSVAGQKGVEKTLFIIFESVDILDAGFEIKPSPGETKCSYFDGMHRDVLIPDLDKYVSLVNALWDKPTVFIEKPEVETGFISLIDDGRYDLTSVIQFRKSLPSQYILDHVIERVRTGGLAISRA